MPNWDDVLSAWQNSMASRMEDTLPATDQAPPGGDVGPIAPSYEEMFPAGESVPAPTPDYGPSADYGPAPGPFSQFLGADVPPTPRWEDIAQAWNASSFADNGPAVGGPPPLPPVPESQWTNYDYPRDPFAAEAPTDLAPQGVPVSPLPAPGAVPSRLEQLSGPTPSDYLDLIRHSYFDNAGNFQWGKLLQPGTNPWLPTDILRPLAQIVAPGVVETADVLGGEYRGQPYTPTWVTEEGPAAVIQWQQVEAPWQRVLEQLTQNVEANSGQSLLRQVDQDVQREARGEQPLYTPAQREAMIGRAGAVMGMFAAGMLGPMHGSPSPEGVPTPRIEPPTEPVTIGEPGAPVVPPPAPSSLPSIPDLEAALTAKGDELNRVSATMPSRMLGKVDWDLALQKYNRDVQILNDQYENLKSQLAVARATPEVATPEATSMRAQESEGVPPTAPTVESATPSPAIANAPAGDTTWASPPDDPTVRYQVQYRVVPLDDLVTSHLDNLEPNPAFDPNLQPKDRTKAASQRQITRIGSQLDPEAMLGDLHLTNKAMPVVGPDGLVESGNGRTLGLRLARDQYPENWAAYQEALPDALSRYGIDPMAVEGMQDPVLVRERISPLDYQQRQDFVRVQNAPDSLGSSTYEQATNDARGLSDAAIQGFTIGDNQSVDNALKSVANRPLVESLIGSLRSNQQEALMGRGNTFTQEAYRRTKYALLAKTYPGEAGMRIGEVITESPDSGIARIADGLFGDLPNMARLEAMVRSGDVAPQYSLANDLATALDTYARLKQNGSSVDAYLRGPTVTEQLPGGATEASRQGTFFGLPEGGWQRETTPFQDRLLEYLDTLSRSSKQVRTFLDSYVDEVTALPSNRQAGMFGEGLLHTPGKEELLDRAVATQRESAGASEQGGVFNVEPATAPEVAAPETGRPKLAQPAGERLGEGAPLGTGEPAAATTGTSGEAPALANTPPAAPVLRTAPGSIFATDSVGNVFLRPDITRTEVEAARAQTEQLLGMSMNEGLRRDMEVRRGLLNDWLTRNKEVEVTPEVMPPVEATSPSVETVLSPEPEVSVPAENLAAEATSLNVPAPAAPLQVTLPRELAGGKPTYGYRDANFNLSFESDVDKALYIVSNPRGQSRADAAYMSFLQPLFPDATEAEIRDMGTRVRNLVVKPLAREEARVSGGGELAVPVSDLARGASVPVKPREVPRAGEEPATLIVEEPRAAAAAPVVEPAAPVVAETVRAEEAPLVEGPTVRTENRSVESAISEVPPTPEPLLSVADSPAAQARIEQAFEGSPRLVDDRQAISDMVDAMRANGDTRPVMDLVNEAIGNRAVQVLGLGEEPAARMPTQVGTTAPRASDMTRDEFIASSQGKVSHTTGSDQYHVTLPDGRLTTVEASTAKGALSKVHRSEVIAAVREALADPANENLGDLGVPREVLTATPEYGRIARFLQQEARGQRAAQEAETARTARAGARQGGPAPGGTEVAQPPTEPGVTPIPVRERQAVEAGPPRNGGALPPGEPARGNGVGTVPPGVNVPPGANIPPLGMGGDLVRLYSGLLGNDVVIQKPLLQRLTALWGEFVKQGFNNVNPVHALEGRAEGLLGRRLTPTELVGESVYVQRGAEGAALMSMKKGLQPILREVGPERLPYLDVILMAEDQVDKGAAIQAAQQRLIDEAKAAGKPVPQFPVREWPWGSDPARARATMQEILQGVDPAHFQALTAEMRQRLGPAVFDRLDLAKLNGLLKGVGPGEMADLQRAAAGVQAYTHSLLERRLQAGVIDKPTFDTLTILFPHYIPIHVLQYVDAERMAGGGGAGRLIGNAADLLRHLTEEGTLNAQESPLRAIVELANATYRVSLRNQTAGKLVQLANLHPGLQSEIHPVAMDYSLKNGESDFFWRDNGQLRRYVASADVANVVRADPAVTNSLESFIHRYLTNPFRMVTTQRNPLFLLRNLMGDLTTATMMGERPQYYLYGVWDRLRNGPATQAFYLGGGAISHGGHYAGKAIESSHKAVEEMAGKPWYVVDSPGKLPGLLKGIATFRWVEDWGAYVEDFPRVGAFWQELTPAQRAQIKAGDFTDIPVSAVAWGRRVTMDFQVMGDFTRHINMMVPYFNPALQGPVQILRLLSDPDRRVGAVLRLGAFMAAVLGLEVYNHQFPEYQDVPQWVKDSNFFVVMLPWSGQAKDAQGRPIPAYVLLGPAREWAPFGIAIREMMNSVYGKPWRGVLRTAGAMQQAWSPVSGEAGKGTLLSFLPPVMSTAIEQAFNRDTFLGKSIVPPQLAAKPPVEQVTLGTSESARFIGGLMNVSPARVDHVISSLLTGLGKVGTGGLDMVLHRLQQEAPIPSFPANEQLWGRYIPKQGQPQTVGPADLARLRAEANAGNGDLYVVSAKDARDAEQKVMAGKVLESVGPGSHPDFASAPFIGQFLMSLYDKGMLPASWSQAPLLGGVIRNYYRTQGGQKSEEGRIAADLAQGAGTAEATALAAQVAAHVSDDVRKAQLELDGQLQRGEISATDWKQKRQVLQNYRQGAFQGAQLALPLAALEGDRAKEYRRIINKVKADYGDQQERAQVLANAYFAIEPPPTASEEEGIKTLLADRRTFLANLDPADRTAVQTLISKNATPMEQQYQQAQDLMGQYMALLNGTPGEKADRAAFWREHAAVLEPWYGGQKDISNKTLQPKGTGSAAGTVTPTAGAVVTPTAGLSVATSELTPAATRYYQIKNALEQKIDAYYDAGTAQDAVDAYGPMSTAERTAFRRSQPAEYQAIQSYYKQRDQMLADPKNADLAAYLRFLDSMGGRDNRQVIERVTGQSSVDMFVRAVLEGLINPYAAVTRQGVPPGNMSRTAGAPGGVSQSRQGAGGVMPTGQGASGRTSTPGRSVAPTAYDQVRGTLENKLRAYYNAGAAKGVVNAYGAMSNAERAAFRQAQPGQYQLMENYYKQRDALVSDPRNTDLAAYLNFARATGQSSVDTFVRGVLDGSINPVAWAQQAKGTTGTNQSGAPQAGGAPQPTADELYQRMLAHRARRNRQGETSARGGGHGGGGGTSRGYSPTGVRDINGVIYGPVPRPVVPFPASRYQRHVLISEPPPLRSSR